MPSPVETARIRGDREQLTGAAGGEHRVARPHLDRRRPLASSARTPTQRPPSTMRSTLKQRSRTSMFGSACAASASARSISAPVASPPACTTRGSEWPPSIASSQHRRRARRTARPSPCSSRTRRGPSVTSTCTASMSQSPAPAVSVSVRWSSAESGSPSAAATPPCAYRVAEVGELALGEHADASSPAGPRGSRPTARRCHCPAPERPSSGQPTGSRQAASPSVPKSDAQIDGRTPVAGASVTTDDVVDEPGPSDPGRHRDHELARRGLERLERRRVADLDVLERHQRLRSDLGAHRRARRVAAALAGDRPRRPPSAAPRATRAPPRARAA